MKELLVSLSQKNRQNKFLKSVAKVQKEQQKAQKDALDRQFKDAEAKLRKDLGLDSVDNIPPAAPKNNTEAQARADYINGVISYSEAIKRGVIFS